MSDTVSIRERICREIAAILTASSIFSGSVRRWDSRGLQNVQPGDCVVSDGDESGENASQGDPGTTLKTMTVDIVAVVSIDEDTAGSTSAIVNRLLARIEAALMADPTFVETGTGVRLAVDSRVTGSQQIPTEDGQPSVVAAVGLEVMYEHNRNNPSVGPGITEVTE